LKNIYKGAKMKIYNMITKQVVNSEKIEELDDRFELTDVGAYEKTIKCYFKPTWREADSKEKLLKNIAECLNNITVNNVLRIVEIARPGNIMFGVKLEHFENRKVLRYSKLTNKILIDGWYIKDNDLEAALKRYLAYEEN
jgi:hypothetical protein